LGNRFEVADDAGEIVLVFGNEVLNLWDGVCPDAEEGYERSWAVCFA
jgi:hypothetical protein